MSITNPINFSNVAKSRMLGATLGAGGYKATILLEGGFRNAFSYPNFDVIDNVLTHSTDGYDTVAERNVTFFTNGF